MALDSKTHTPIPFWLDLPLYDLGIWTESVSTKIKKETPKQ